jgi:hypothetical protein
VSHTLGLPHKHRHWRKACLSEGTADNQKSANTSLTTDELQHTMPQQHIVDGRSLLWVSSGILYGAPSNTMMAGAIGGILAPSEYIEGGSVGGLGPCGLGSVDQGERDSVKTVVL